MKIIEQSCQWEQEPPADVMQIIERAGRTCYKSEDKITPDSAREFVRLILSNGHHSVIEHVTASLRFITTRTVSHEIVRHRLCSYSQESSRWCNYSKGKFGGEITVVKPVWLVTEEQMLEWKAAMEDAERRYFKLLTLGWTAEKARDALPHAMKTEMVMTTNLRGWLHFLTTRCSPKCDPRMQDLAKKALGLFYGKVPVLFDKLAQEYLPREYRPR